VPLLPPIEQDIDVTVPLRPPIEQDIDVTVPLLPPPWSNDDINDINWVIEGVEDLDADGHRHMNAFYTNLHELFSEKDKSIAMMTKNCYDKRVEFCLSLAEGGDCRSAFLSGTVAAYKWAKKYHVVTVGEESKVLVLRPKIDGQKKRKERKERKGLADVTQMRLGDFQQPTYLERLFSDLSKIHIQDHCKGNTLFTRARDRHGNITREVCKIFTDVCPHCVKVLSRNKPTAGIKNIVTEGFGVRGQVDLIDFQSMPDGSFKYLLNYIDHGVKKLTSIPLTSKRASSVAFALFTIFTEQGPPTILQSDNGGEFSNHAHNHVGRRLMLDDDFIDLVIKELKNLWHECMSVRGSPRHSESNGGVERVNQTVQTKLGGWMKTNNSQHWSIGCKIVQWRINTQLHVTIKDTPYHLTYGQHPRVGISNLPVSAAVLQNLSTEAQLQDIYSSMNVDGVPALLSTADGSSLGNTGDTLMSQSMLNVDVPNSALGKRKERSPKESSLATRQAQSAKLQLTTAVVLQNETVQDVMTSPSGGIPSPGTAKSEGDNIDIRWVELIKSRDIILDIDEISNARINSVFPIIYCTNNKDINDMANWASCILRKVRKDQYEVLDEHERHKLEDDIDWGGDEGLHASWLVYYKYPNSEFIEAKFQALQDIVNDAEIHDVSPNRQSLRKKAAENVLKRADKVKATVLKKSPSLVFKCGDVVLVPLDDVDRTKVDGANLAGVVVSMSKLKSTCRVAVKQGVLHRAYAYHALKPVPTASNNLDAMDLRDAYENWRSLPQLTEREAARFVSSVGGQGIVHCNCRGSCLTNSCSCKKANRLCSSRCHRNSKNCKNTPDE